MVGEGNLVETLAVDDIGDGPHQAPVADAMAQHLRVAEVGAVDFLRRVVHVLHIHEDGHALAAEESTRRGVSPVVGDLARARVEVQESTEAPDLVLEVEVFLLEVDPVDALNILTGVDDDVVAVLLGGGGTGGRDRLGRRLGCDGFLFGRLGFFNLFGLIGFLDGFGFLSFVSFGCRGFLFGGCNGFFVFGRKDV